MKKVKSTIVCIFILALLSCGGDGSNNNGRSPGDNPILTWDENTETDLAGYIVYWGPNSRDYDHSLDVGLDRIVYILQLELHEPVTYFAVTAYDTSGNESDYSEEVVYP